MKEEESGYGIYVVIALAMIASVVVVSMVIHHELKVETIIVEGKIVETEFWTDETALYDIDYLNITLDSGEEYIIRMWDNEYDLTVNSKLILKLKGNSDTNIWEIKKIIKVPD